MVSQLVKGAKLEDATRLHETALATARAELQEEDQNITGLLVLQAESALHCLEGTDEVILLSELTYIFNGSLPRLYLQFYANLLRTPA